MGREKYIFGIDEPFVSEAAKNDMVKNCSSANSWADRTVVNNEKTQDVVATMKWITLKLPARAIGMVLQTQKHYIPKNISAENYRITTYVKLEKWR